MFSSIILVTKILAAVLLYVFSGVLMGGLVTGAIFPHDGPMEHKVSIAIIGNLWNIGIILLFVFLV